GHVIGVQLRTAELRRFVGGEFNADRVGVHPCLGDRSAERHGACRHCQKQVPSERFLHTYLLFGVTVRPRQNPTAGTPRSSQFWFTKSTGWLVELGNPTKPLLPTFIRGRGNAKGPALNSKSN